MADDAGQLKSMIPIITDFPQKGIRFRDITPVLADPRAFRAIVDAFVAEFESHRLDVVASIEAHGFPLGGAVAYALNKGFVSIRKLGKLPRQTVRASYLTEYSQEIIEINQDAFGPGARVLLVDDVLASGGTLNGAIQLIENLGGYVDTVAVLIELYYPTARATLRGQQPGYNVFSLVKYDPE